MRIKLKICGLTYAQSIAEVGQLHPDYMGFIFYQKSPRYFDGIIPELPESIQKVGVFVQESIPSIIEKTQQHALNLVQLHGGESVNFCTELRNELQKNNLKSVQIIKVFHIENKRDFDLISTFETVCDYYLFDTKSDHYGGTGTAFDWSLLQQQNVTKPYFLSGGIGLDTIKTIATLGLTIHALDVNSKFEIQPGLKNCTQLKTLQDELSR